MSKYRFDQIAINSTAKKKPTEEDKYHYIGLEHIDSQNLIVSRWGSEIAPKGEKLLMKKGDVLFGKRRAYQKKVAIAPFDGIFSAHGMVLRPNEEVVDKDFFPMFISSDYFLDAAIAISVGSLSPTINWKDLARLEFDLPPIEEQQKLAKVLWSINDTLQAYQNLLAETDELTNAQFEILFGQGQWETVSADTIFTDMRNGVSPSSKGKYNEKVLTLSAITQGAFDPSAWKQETFDTPPSEDKRICAEDFYMCRGNGNRALVGVGVYSTEERSDLVYPDTVIAARIDKQKVCLPYLCCAWKQHFVRNQIEAAAKTTNGIYKINQKSLSQVQIILPPITLQHRFSEFLFQVDKAKATLQNTSHPYNLQSVASWKTPWEQGEKE